MKKIFLSLIVLCFVLPECRTFALGGELVFDFSNFMQAAQNGATMVNTLNKTTETAETVGDQLELAKKNSAALGIDNWEDVSNIVSQANNAADIAGSMTYATDGAVNTFDNLFPGEQSSTANYTNMVARRTSGTLSTFKGSLSATKSLGDAVLRFKKTLSGLKAAQGLIQGHESAQEQGNQIAGNILNTEQLQLNALLTGNNNASAFYANEVQKEQDSVNALKNFIDGKNHGSIDYKDDGQGNIPTNWY